LRFGAQALNGVHHIGLLGQHGIAELLGPVELVTHRRQHRRRRHEFLHAGVPILLFQGFFELLVFQLLVFFREAVGLHNLERVSRGHEHLRDEAVRIERDRRHERVELALAEGLFSWCRCFGPSRRIIRGEGGPRERGGDGYDCENCAEPHGIGLQPAISSHQGRHDWYQIRARSGLAAPMHSEVP
jgi:hypothetical protein